MKKVISVFVMICVIINCFAIAAMAEDPYVVNIYLCARKTASPLGHLWVYFENLTEDEYLEVGTYTLAPGEGVSVGTWGTKGADGPGVYYNAEAYSVGNYGVSGIISVKDSLTKEELEKVSREIKKRNFWEPFFMNCMGFAFHIWNVNCRPFMIPMVFPFIGRLAMLALCDESRDLVMYTPDRTQVFKQVKKDSQKQVSDKMLKKLM